MNVSGQRSSVVSKREFIACAALLCGLVLGGCSTSSIDQVIDRVPASVGGIPTEAPERPVQQVAYPAVHDMPPPRPNTTLSAEEQVQFEDEMTKVRASQQAITAASDGQPKPAKPVHRTATKSVPVSAPGSEPVTTGVVPSSSNNSIY